MKMPLCFYMQPVLDPYNGQTYFYCQNLLDRKQVIPKLFTAIFLNVQQYSKKYVSLCFVKLV